MGCDPMGPPTETWLQKSAISRELVVVCGRLLPRRFCSGYVPENGAGRLEHATPSFSWPHGGIRGSTR